MNIYIDTTKPAICTPYQIVSQLNELSLGMSLVKDLDKAKVQIEACKFTRDNLKRIVTEILKEAGKKPEDIKYRSKQSRTMMTLLLGMENKEDGSDRSKKKGMLHSV